MSGDYSLVEQIRQAIQNYPLSATWLILGVLAEAALLTRGLLT